MYSYVPSLVVPYSCGFWLLPTECFARANMNVFVWEGWIFLSVGVCDCLPLQGLELDAQMGLWQSYILLTMKKQHSHHNSTSRTTVRLLTE